VHITTEKYKTIDIIRYLKRHLFTELGDKADNCVEKMFLDSSEVNWNYMRQLNLSFWDEPEVIKSYIKIIASILILDFILNGKTPQKSLPIKIFRTLMYSYSS